MIAARLVRIWRIQFRYSAIVRTLALVSIAQPVGRYRIASNIVELEKFATHETRCGESLAENKSETLRRNYSETAESQTRLQSLLHRLSTERERERAEGERKKAASCW